MRWNTCACMPRTFAATTIGSPELSMKIRSASSRLISERALKDAAVFAGISLKRRVFQAANQFALRRHWPTGWPGAGDIEIGENQSALFRRTEKEQVYQFPPFSIPARSRAAAQAVEFAEDGSRRCGYCRQLCVNCGARLCVDRINQAEHQFNILGFLFRAMRRSLHI